MKKIKAFIIIPFLLILCCSLSACVWDPGSYYFTSEELADVISIELINYDNPGQKEFASWVPDHTSDLKPFDSTKMNCLETLDESRITDFIDSLCEYELLYEFFVFDSPKDICIKLNYSNGDFLIIWGDYKAGSHVGYIGKFSPDGEVIKFFGCFLSLNYYKDLVNNFFQTQI